MWMRTAVGIVESSHIRVMRVADNMRNVAVTEGDKVEAQIKFGWMLIQLMKLQRAWIVFRQETSTLWWKNIMINMKFY